MSDFSVQIRNGKRRADAAIDAQDQNSFQHTSQPEQPAQSQVEKTSRQNVNLRITTDYDDSDPIPDPEVSLSPKSKSQRPSDKIKRETRRQVAWGSVEADDAIAEEEVAQYNKPVLTTPSTSKVPGLSSSGISPGELEEHDDLDEADMQAHSEPIELSEPSLYEWEQDDSSLNNLRHNTRTMGPVRAEQNASRGSKPGFNNVLYRGNTDKTESFISPSRQSVRRHIHNQAAADKIHDMHMQIHMNSGGHGRSASWLLKRAQVADDGAIWISEDAVHEKKTERVNSKMKSIRNSKKGSQTQRGFNMPANKRAPNSGRRASFLKFQKHHGRSVVHANGGLFLFYFTAIFCYFLGVG